MTEKGKRNSVQARGKELGDCRMLFNSYIFWLFFLTVAAVYRFLDHRRRNLFLVLASYFFYGYWDWRFLGLIAASTFVDFIAARRIDEAARASRRRGWLLISLIVNFGLLAVFKYLGFFVGEFNDLMDSIGGGMRVPAIDLILPVGISFYTFQTVSYTVDVFWRRTKPVKDFANFALYVSFFPQLVAGPIERSESLLPQVIDPRPRLNEARFREGLLLVLTGLYRKVVIADNMALIANHVFGRPASENSPVEVMLGVYAFAFQIYGDFSGYSAIAQGTAKWLGFDLMDNFRQPYFATSPQDFWRRWHISLSSWLRDYLYIPLGGNRSGRGQTYRNLMLTMLLGGLWHGAAWTFVVWGGIHGAWLAIHRAFGRRLSGGGGQGRGGALVKKLVGWFVTFHLVCLTWLFFRSQSIEQAWEMLLQVFGPEWGWNPMATGFASLMLFFLLPLVIYEGWVERRGDLLALAKVPWFWRALGYGFIIGMLLFFGAPERQEFIYFRF